MGEGKSFLEAPGHSEFSRASLDSYGSSLRVADDDGIRILIVEDHEAARRGIRLVLSRRQGIQVVGEAGTGEEAIRMAQELHPDIILLDIGLPGLSGIDVANTLRRAAPELRIIFVSQHNSPLLAKEALLTGAFGYVVKSDAALDLLPAIDAVHQGYTFISRGMSR